MSKMITDERFREIKYRCSKDSCGHTQVIRYFLDDTVLPFTCCVTCRAGFGIEPGQMAAQHIGMFPIAEVSQLAGARA
jgi:hypothetical protein